MISLTLTGRPMSINHLYKTGRNKATGRSITYMTEAGKNAKIAWGIEAKAQLSKQRGSMFMGDNLVVRISFYFEDRLRRDIDNYSKALLDCLSGVIWKDDCQIVELHIEKHYVEEEGDRPRTEVFIRELNK